MNAQRPGEEQPEQVSPDPPYRWLPVLSPKGGESLRLNADETIAKMLTSFQGTRKAGQDSGVDAKLVTYDGTVVLVQTKHYAKVGQRHRKPTEKITARIATLLVAATIVYELTYVSPLRAAVVMIFWILGIAAGKTLHRVSWRPILAEFSVKSLTGIAALLAGRGRQTLRWEWAAHLAGESGHDRVNPQKVKDALGFLISAVRFRCSDMTDAAWIPVDVILESRALSNLCVLIPTTAAGCVVLRHEGTLGVITSAESITAIAIALYGLIRTGRWWRDVKPPEPKARQAKE